MCHAMEMSHVTGYARIVQDIRKSGKTSLNLHYNTAAEAILWFQQNINMYKVIMKSYLIVVRLERLHIGGFVVFSTFLNNC